MAFPSKKLDFMLWFVLFGIGSRVILSWYLSRIQTRTWRKMRKLTPFGFWTYELAYILERHSWKLDSHAFKESKQTKLDSKAPFCDQTWVPKQLKMFRSHYHHQNMVHYFMNLNKVLWNISYSKYSKLLYYFDDYFSKHYIHYSKYSKESYSLMSFGCGISKMVGPKKQNLQK